MGTAGLIPEGTSSTLRGGWLHSFLNATMLASFASLWDTLKISEGESLQSTAVSQASEKQ